MNQKWKPFQFGLRDMFLVVLITAMVCAQFVPRSTRFVEHWYYGFPIVYVPLPPRVFAEPWRFDATLLWVINVPIMLCLIGIYLYFTSDKMRGIVKSQRICFLAMLAVVLVSLQCIPRYVPTDSRPEAAYWVCGFPFSYWSYHEGVRSDVDPFLLVADLLIAVAVVSLIAYVFNTRKLPGNLR